MSSATYAVCRDCGLNLATADAARHHQSETLDAAEPDQFGNRRSHTTRTLHTTPQERTRRTVHTAVEDVLMEFADDMDRRISRGDLTAAEVSDALRTWPDFADYWTDWQNEENR